jgi:putative transposase
VHALLRRQAEKNGRAAPNVKRVYRVMKVHGLLLQRDGECREERRHDGRVAVDQRNTRWCSDELEIACDNGEKVRVASRWTVVTVRRWGMWRRRAAHRRGRPGPDGRHG